MERRMGAPLCLPGGSTVRTLAVVLAAAAVGCGFAPRHPVTVTLPSPRAARAAGASGLAGWMTATAAGVPVVVATALGLGTALLPGLLRRRSRDRRSRADARRWPDFLAAVRSRLATGAAIPAACADAARHVGGRFLDLAAPGMPFADLAATTRDRWADPLADRVLTTLELANQVGGTQVGAVLGALTESVNADLRLRRAHEAALTEQRLTAGVALCAPWLILTLTVLTNPTSAEAFSTRTGHLIIAGGGVATIAGYLMARRSARLSRPPRLFG